MYAQRVLVLTVALECLHYLLCVLSVPLLRVIMRMHERAKEAVRMRVRV